MAESRSSIRWARRTSWTVHSGVRVRSSFTRASPPLTPSAPTVSAMTLKPTVRHEDPDEARPRSRERRVERVLRHVLVPLACGSPALIAICDTEQHATLHDEVHRLHHEQRDRRQGSRQHARCSFAACADLQGSRVWAVGRSTTAPHTSRTIARPGIQVTVDTP